MLCPVVGRQMNGEEFVNESTVAQTNYYTRIRLDELRKTTKILVQEN
jgi:hypothetical protein